jgi:hypothetical protein
LRRFSILNENMDFETAEERMETRKIHLEVFHEGEH